MTRAYRFGPFELHPARQQLLRDGRPVAVGQRALDVLVALVEHAGELVGKDELLARVWPGLVVEESNLPVQVSALRKVLGSTAIVTAANRGYRFALEVAPVEARRGVPARRHNLPQPLTSFIGHEDDLAEYAAIVPHARLLTLTGIGGSGKSRLAIELATRLAPAFDDGAWYVDLAPLLDAERVALTTAAALGLREESGRPIEDLLCAHLATRHALIVLDNCEHLTAACAALTRRVLDVAPGVHVLAASREGLGVPGERAVTVRSLSIPPAGAPHDFALARNSEAVRLFAERAALADARFVLADEDVPIVAEVCRRLDGIPLALELAAARVKLLSVSEIRARLDDRFRLLTGSSRAALGRQRTLIATIQWSYDHLDADEQALLRHIAVFAGGCTLQGAMHVADETSDEYAVLERMERLVDQSLLTTQRAAGGTRYRLLESVREYALERLRDAGEGSAARARHLRHFVALAEAAEPQIIGPQQGEWLARLDPEVEDLLAAHDWCDEDPDGAELDLRLVFSLRMFLRQRGLTSLGRTITGEALVRDGADAPTAVRGRALFAAGEHAYFMGLYDESRAFATGALAIATAIGNEFAIAEAERLTGYVELALGRPAEARRLMVSTLARSRRIGDAVQLSSALNGLAEMLRSEGDLAAAEPLYEESAAMCRASGDRGNIAVHLANLAWTRIGLRRLDDVAAMLREAFGIAVEIGARRIGVALLDTATGFAVATGAWERAATLHGARGALAAAMGYQREPADERSLRPMIEATRDALGPDRYAAALASGQAQAYDEAMDAVMRDLAASQPAPVTG